MTIHTCMGCGLQTRYSYGRACVGCGRQARRSYGHRPDWYLQAELALAAPLKIVRLSEQHPTAAMVLTVPGVIIAIAAVAAYPFVFVPLLILLGVALVASARYDEARTPAE